MQEHGYKNLWMSPNVAIIRLNLLIEKYGIKTVVRNGLFRHEREAWIAASFLLGWRENNNEEYWLEIEMEEATPDIHGYTLRPLKRGFHREDYNFEIVEWEEHSKGILDVIKKKCKKCYPNYFLLLVYARKRGELIDYEKVHDEIKNNKVPFLDIWILAASSNSNDYHLTRVYRDKFQICFNLNEALKKVNNQSDYATNLGRGGGTDRKNLGVVYVPLPELKK